MRWLRLIRPGDWLVIVLSALLIALSLPRLWQGGLADKAVIRLNGEIVATLTLQHPERMAVQGPLGPTWIEIAPGRARILSDPSPRQYCVKHGWLSHPGEVALCAPNRVSLQITGRTRVYDALSY